MSRRNGPGGGLPNHDHSGAGQGGAELIPGEITSAVDDNRSAYGGGFVRGGEVIPQVEVATVEDSALAVQSQIFIQGNYAYVSSLGFRGEDGSLTVLDISNPSFPKLVASTTIPESAQGVFVKGNYAFVAGSSDGNEFAVVDVSDPTSLTVQYHASHIDIINRIFVRGTHAYLLGDNLGILDVSDPESLPSVLEFEGEFTFDVLNLDSLFVAGDYAYVSGSVEPGLFVIDVSDPTAPIEAATLSTPALSSANIFLHGKYAYASGESNFSVVDISNPTNPTEVGTLTLDEASGADNLFVRGDYAYVVGGTSISVLDVSDPTTTRLDNTYSVGVATSDIFVHGDYAYVTSDSTDGTVRVLGRTSTPLSPTYDEATANSLTVNNLIQATKATETIASGSISYSAPFLQVEGEGGAADDLTDITGGEEGTIVILEPGGETITVEHGTGNLRLGEGSNKTLDASTDKLMLINRDGTVWCQIGFANN